MKDAENLQASGVGHRWEIPETGATIFCGWSGSISASGHQMTLWMAGGLIEFAATGTGKVYLSGRGTHVINSHEGAKGPIGATLRISAVETASS